MLRVLLTTLVVHVLYSVKCSVFKEEEEGGRPDLQESWPNDFRVCLAIRLLSAHLELAHSHFISPAEACKVVFIW